MVYEDYDAEDHRDAKDIECHYTDPDDTEGGFDNPRDDLVGVCHVAPAWEDTVLYPAFRSVITPREFVTLGDKFEDKEQELFGKDGFEKIVVQVAELEKQLGLLDLSQFTPKG